MYIYSLLFFDSLKLIMLRNSRKFCNILKIGWRPIIWEVNIAMLLLLMGMLFIFGFLLKLYRIYLWLSPCTLLLFGLLIRFQDFIFLQKCFHYLNPIRTMLIQRNWLSLPRPFQEKLPYALP